MSVKDTRGLFNTAVNDEKLEWCYSEHAALARGEKISRDTMLGILDRLKKQNEYAHMLSCEVRTLRKWVNDLEKENKFLLEQLQEQS